MIIEIGTSDFNTNAGKVDGIFIEPVKFYYDRLPDCKKENVAISNVEGELDMFSLTEPQIKEYKLPNWIRGCSSLAKMHPTMAKELKKRGLSQDIVNVDKVPVVRIKSIIEKYGLEEIDYLKVDTEGHDCVIINDLLDTVDIKPKKIKFENNVLSAKADVKLLVERLKHDYDIKYLKNDIECYLKTIKMEFTLKQLFNLVDGRLSTQMGDIYTMLNHITQENLYTHQLPVAMRYVEKINPPWFQMVKEKLDKIKEEMGDGFETLMDHIDEKYSDDIWDIPCLSDYQKEGFEEYMLENS